MTFHLQFLTQHIDEFNICFLMLCHESPSNSSAAIYWDSLLGDLGAAGAEVPELGSPAGGLLARGAKVRPRLRPMQLPRLRRRYRSAGAVFGQGWANCMYGRDQLAFMRRSDPVS